ncbi:MAG: hypothetical protein ACTSU8_05750 [Alphaproteobacteria bacterium]
MPRKSQLLAAQERHREHLTDAKETKITIGGDPYTVALTQGSYEIEGQRAGASDELKILTFLLSKIDHPARPPHGKEVLILEQPEETGKYTLDAHRNNGNHWLVKASL